MNNPKLSYEAKMLIRNYLIKKLIWIVTAASILSFFIGFFVRDIARAEAYNKAYSEAAQTIIQLTNRASESANKIKGLEEQFTAITNESKLVLKEASALKDKIGTTLIIQKSDNIISSITENLLNNKLFQDAIISHTTSKISELESRTKYLSVDNFGNTIIKSDIKLFGVMTAYDVGLMDKKK